MWFSAQGTKLAYAAFNETLVPTVSMQHYGIPETMYDQYSQAYDYHYPKVSHQRVIRNISCGWNQIYLYSVPCVLQVDDPNPTVELFVQNLNNAVDVPIAIKPVKNYKWIKNIQFNIVYYSLISSNRMLHRRIAVLPSCG